MSNKRVTTHAVLNKHACSSTRISESRHSSGGRAELCSRVRVRSVREKRPEQSGSPIVHQNNQLLRETDCSQFSTNSTKLVARKLMTFEILV